MTKKALVLVDVQNDFLPGGALAVTSGNKILPIINQLLSCSFDLIIATKDWHPKDHSSFAANHNKNPGEMIMLGNIEQILWPTHCVQDTYGAEFSPHLDHTKINEVFHKGTDKTIDSYSTFFDNGHHKSTGLADYLKKHHVHELFIVGLATDYCVKYSVLDALQLGFKVFVITDACKGVNLRPHDSNDALHVMKEAGAVLITSKEVNNFI